MPAFNRQPYFHLFSPIFFIFILIPTAFTAQNPDGPVFNLLASGNSSSIGKLAAASTPSSTMSVECKEPLMGSTSWECQILEESVEIGGGNSSKDGAWEEFEEEERNLAVKMGKNVSNEKMMPNQMRGGQLQVFYSNKVNRSTGQLFISALIRWDFDSQLFHSAYSVYLRIQEDSNENNGTVDGRQRLFSIPLAPIRNGTSKNGKSQQRVELLIRLDGFFEFGNSYRLKIISSLPNESGKKALKQRPLVAQTQIQFAELPNEFDTAICPHWEKNNENAARNEFDLELLAQRQALASRWTGSLRSVQFFPLHSAINVTFFAAPPSHCIPGYRVQLWLLNSFQQEKLIQTDQLVREGPGIFVGATEFRDLLKGDGRFKYRIKLLPIEQWENGGDCVCKLEGKCGCVQVYTNPFTMLNASGSSDSDEGFLPSALAILPESVPSSAEDSGGRSPLAILLACLLLALTLVLLSFALLLLILRNGNRAGRKRRTLLIFRNAAKSGEEFGGLVGSSCRKSQMSMGSGAAFARPDIKSVLLLNAQPGKRPELERFARLLVKNGVRVFYDRWDRVSIERNLLLWVHQAITKADKTILFWDRRAEELLTPPSNDNATKQRLLSHQSVDGTTADGEDLFDRVFCALHQQLDPENTIYVKWDESTSLESHHRPIGSITETVFLFHRDLKLIYAALKVPISEQELRELEHRNMGRPPQHKPESLVLVVPKMAKKKVPEKVELLTYIEGGGEGKGTSSSEETFLEGNNEKDEGICSGTFSGELPAQKQQKLGLMGEKKINEAEKVAQKIGKNIDENDAAQLDSGIESAVHVQ